MRYSLGERGGSVRAAGWSEWLLATPTILQRPEPFGTRSRATAMASLPMFALHVWSEPSHQSSVVCRDSACASPRRLQAAQVVETKRELLDRDRAMAAAAAVAERPILSHAHGRQSDRHRPHRGCVEVAAWQAAEGLERQSLGWQPCLLGLGLGSRGPNPPA